MAREKKAPPPKKGCPLWMGTFSDLMTLLLCFFVLLFAMAETDVEKFQAFVNSFNGSTGIIDGGEVLMNVNGMVGSGVDTFPQDDELIAAVEKLKEQLLVNEMEEIKQEIEDYIIGEDIEQKVSVERNGSEIIITFEDTLLFDSGQATIKAVGLPIIESIGLKILGYLDDGYFIICEGHTDNVPISTVVFPSNWELSASRAIAVAKFFVDELGFDPSNLSAEGFGEYRPIGDNSTEEGRAANRRVEVKIIK